MPAPFNPQELRRLEAEAAEADKKGDHLDALDIYEEVVRNGWAAARHLTAMGFCYMKIRQRQDARSCWLRAFAMDPSHQPVLDALDQYFPGWEHQTAGISTGSGRREEPDAAPPPPPPPPSAAGGVSATSSGITIEAVTPREVPPPRAPEPAPAPPAQPAVRPAATARPAAPAPPPAPAQEDEFAAFSGPTMSMTTPNASIAASSVTINSASTTAGPAAPSALQAAAPRAAHHPQAAAPRAASFGSKVNWPYVMEDAAAEAAHQLATHRH